MRDLLYRIAREGLASHDLTPDEAHDTIAAAIESYRQEMEGDDEVWGFGRGSWRKSVEVDERSNPNIGRERIVDDR